MAIHTYKILVLLRKHWLNLGKPQPQSLNGDPITDIYNDILIQKKQGYTDKDIILYINEHACENVQHILGEFKKNDLRL